MPERADLHFFIIGGVSFTRYSFFSVVREGKTYDNKGGIRTLGLKCNCYLLNKVS